MFKWLRKLLPQFGPKKISVKEGEKRLKEMKERIAMSRKKENK